MTEDATPREDTPEPSDAAARPEGERASDAPVAQRAAKDKGGAADKPEDAAAGEAAPRPAQGHPGYAFLAVVSVITLAADLGSKWWALHRLDGPVRAAPPIELVRDHVYLNLAKNPGGAWGILGRESADLRRAFFLVISAGAILFILALYRKLDPKQTALKWGLPLVLGGAVGNLVDRIRYEAVVDFIQVKVTATFVWPTFNVADIAIVAGVILMGIDMFVPRRPDPAASEAAAQAGEG